MICCREVAVLLIDYVACELQADQCREVDEHLCQCPHCAAYVESYRMTIRICRHLPAQPVPPQVMARLQARLG
jgi:RNA polymerase sigma-70 factor (ECF subfamily)